MLTAMERPQDSEQVEADLSEDTCRRSARPGTRRSPPAPAQLPAHLDRNDPSTTLTTCSWPTLIGSSSNDRTRVVGSTRRPVFAGAIESAFPHLRLGWPNFSELNSACAIFIDESVLTGLNRCLRPEVTVQHQLTVPRAGANMSA